MITSCIKTALACIFLMPLAVLLLLFWRDSWESCEIPPP